MFRLQFHHNIFLLHLLATNLFTLRNPPCSSFFNWATLFAAACSNLESTFWVSAWQSPLKAWKSPSINAVTVVELGSNQKIRMPFSCIRVAHLSHSGYSMTFLQSSHCQCLKSRDQDLWLRTHDHLRQTWETRPPLKTFFVCCLLDVLHEKLAIDWTPTPSCNWRPKFDISIIPILASDIGKRVNPIHTYPPVLVFGIASLLKM